jgi:hypothetical protein
MSYIQINDSYYSNYNSKIESLIKEYFDLKIKILTVKISGSKEFISTCKAVLSKNSVVIGKNI